MALNLWKIGGKPTSYSPLPTGYGNYMSIGIGDYQITFRAKSASRATIRVMSAGGVDFGINTVLSTSFQTYTMFGFSKSSQPMYIVDLNNIGDIIIDSITLVQKPLNKLTINGIDGFLSGKWNINPSVTIQSDDLLVLNATGNYQYSYLIVDVLLNTVYTFSCDNNASLGVYSVDGSTAIVSTTQTKSITFNSGSNSKVRLYLNNGSLGTGTFTFSKPQLNLGSIPAPYSPKTGDRMVLPTAKKNIFDGKLESGYYGTDGSKSSGSNVSRSVNYIPVKPNTQYVLKNFDNASTFQLNVVYCDVNKVRVNNFIDQTLGKSIYNFTTSPNCYFIVFSMDGMTVNDRIQIEQGTIASYTPYNVQVNKKPQRNNANGQPIILPRKTGLSFNGLTDYLQLPSMTMDAIEIDCLIDVNQPQSNPFLLDARFGLANGYFNIVGAGTGWSNMFVDGVSKPSMARSDIPGGKRTKIKLISQSSFTDDITIFNNYANSAGCINKGIIYKITCYLNNNIVAQYDFENPKNIIGNQVIPNAQNLIPSFEDARWSINVNAKVLGKDVLHLDATAPYQQSIIKTDCLPSTKYKMLCNSKVQVNVANDTNGVWIGSSINDSFITPSDVTKLRIIIDNGNTSSGSFDFIKPQLYQLSDKEGTIYGSPVQLNKPSKRNLYAKR